MKKFISFLSACLLALSCIALNASADDSLISNSVLMYPVYRSASYDSLSERFNIPNPSSLPYIYYQLRSNAVCFIFFPDVEFDEGYPKFSGTSEDHASTVNLDVGSLTGTFYYTEIRTDQEPVSVSTYYSADSWVQTSFPA